MPPPRRRPTPPPTPPRSGLRGAVERRSSVALVYLSQRPSWTLPVVTGLLLVTGLLAPPTLGVPLLLLVLALVGWLSYLSWPAVQGLGRGLRLGVLALLALAVLQRLL